MTLQEAQFDLRTLENQNTQLTKRIAFLTSEKAELERRLKVLDEARILIEMLKTSKIRAKKDFILQVINTALHDIFGSDIRIDIVSTDDDESLIGKTKNIKIKYDLILYENDIEIAKNEKIISSNGGGVLSIVSLLMKILTGYIYSKNKFFIFDESLAQVSEKFQERLSLFLRNFCEAYDFTLVLINHNPKLSTHAHLKYTLYDKGDPKNPKLKNLQIAERQKNFTSDFSEFYEVDIRNFQSIRHLELQFKNFVSITGPNNIGKSAMVRAINAFLFNTFQENYLRFGESRASVKLSHVRGDNIRWGEVVYQQKKITYRFWDGEKFTGKRLAQDKIREKIEALGFRYLNPGNMYKNWKSGVKEQAERIYVTTQYDSLYLIGNKSSDNDKLFNFLFNAESIAMALVNINYDIRKLQDSLRVVEENLDKDKLLKEILDIKWKIQIDKYQKLLIDKYKQITVQIGLGASILKIAEQLRSKQHYIGAYSKAHTRKQLETSVAYIQNILAYFYEFRRLTSESIARYRRIHQLEQLKEMYEISRKSIDHAQERLEFTKNIRDNLKQLNDKINYIVNIKNYLRRYNEAYQKYISIDKQLQIIKEEKKQFIEQADVQPCECCNGRGYVLKI